MSLPLSVVRHLLVAAFFGASAIAISPVFADFGEADTGENISNQISRFEAWCGESGNNCLVEFDRPTKSIIVNASSRVKAENIIDFNYSIQKRKCAITIFTGNNCAIPIQSDRIIIDIEYRKTGGIISSARIIFGSLPAGRKFIGTLSDFTGIKADEGTSNRIDVVD